MLGIVSYYVSSMFHYMKNAQGFHVHSGAIFNTGIVPVEFLCLNFPLL